MRAWGRSFFRRNLPILTAALAAALIAGCNPEQSDAPSPLSDLESVLTYPLGTTIKPLSRDDPLAREVTRERNRIVLTYAGGPARAEFGPPLEMEGIALARLFPGIRFFVLTWDEQPKDANAPPLGLGGGLALTLAISPGSKVRRLRHSGEYREFGRMLSSQGVSIRSEPDARAIWAAFCEIHLKHWHDHRIERVSDSLWRLGVTEIDGVTYAYEVRLEPDGRVQSAQLTAE